jgi:SpoVK/Ycf46/Vps4 family AAA+-type ATPase
LLLDEVDSLCPRKGARGLTSYQARASAQLFTLLDRADQITGLVVIATTNRPNALDPAIRRPGRLETEVFVYTVHTKYFRLLLFYHCSDNYVAISDENYLALTLF